MTLPKPDMPIFEKTLPSTKAKIKIRPMTTKEEKILLIAKQGDDPAEILSAVKQVVGNCLLDDRDVGSLAAFDIEYLYVNIFAVSKTNKVKVSYRDNEDNKVRDFDVNLSDVEVVFPEEDYRKVVANDKISLLFKYPEAKIYDDKAFMDLEGEKVFEELAVRCLDKVYEGDTAFEATTMKPEEIREWLDTLPAVVYDQTRKLFSNLPTLRYEIKYTNDNNKERKIVLSTLNDFFTLR